jgi:N4-gp56 family major capsid protein
MGETTFTTSHGLTVKRWNPALAVEAENKQYFKKFIGTGEDAMIKALTDLSKGNKGDRITVGLSMKLKGDGIWGDNSIEGTSAEEALELFDCSVFITQRRKGVKSKGKLSDKRVLFDFRSRGVSALSTWFAEDADQLLFAYLSGSRGSDTTFHIPTAFTGIDGNNITDIDSNHVIYAGDASAITDLTEQDKMHINIIEKCNAKAETLDPMIQPFMINGEKKFVLLMHTWQKYDLRTSISDNDWLRIHRDTDGKDSPIYKNALGEYGGVIMHDHRNVIRLSSATTPAMASGMTGARALFLGAQAGIICFGGATDTTRYDLNEETEDRGNKTVLTGSNMMGMQRAIYDYNDDGTDETIGLFAVDTYAADPNA